MKQYIYGYHSIEEAVKKGLPENLLLFSKTKGRCDYLISLAQSKGIPVKKVSDEELDVYCDRKHHRGIILVFEQKQKERKQSLREFDELFKKEYALVIILDCITDPHNYGAVLRSCDQFAADLVIIPGRNSAQSAQSAQSTETVAVTSAGTNMYVKQCTVTNLNQAIEYLKEKGFWVFGADVSGQPVDKTDFKTRVALVMGSEGKGIRSLVKENCDSLVRIPCSGHIDSLNVSVAAGIFLYEIRRQQQHE